MYSVTFHPINLRIWQWPIWGTWNLKNLVLRLPTIYRVLNLSHVDSFLPNKIVELWGQKIYSFFIRPANTSTWKTSLIFSFDDKAYLVCQNIFTVQQNENVFKRYLHNTKQHYNLYIFVFCQCVIRCLSYVAIINSKIVSSIMSSLISISNITPILNIYLMIESTYLNKIVVEIVIRMWKLYWLQYIAFPSVGGVSSLFGLLVG